MRLREREIEREREVSEDDCVVYSDVCDDHRIDTEEGNLFLSYSVVCP